MSQTRNSGKTRHNEVAPNQFELAPIFEDVNLANDHNQLVMDLMKRIASKHNFTVLLHEKPFKGVNGSGKHNNWSLCTDTGINLFSPAKTAEGNMLFLTFIVNVLMMVYKTRIYYVPLLSVPETAIAWEQMKHLPPFCLFS